MFQQQNITFSFLWWAQLVTWPCHRHRQAGSYYQRAQTPWHEACKWQLTGSQGRGTPLHYCLQHWGTTSPLVASQNVPSLGFQLLWNGSVHSQHSNSTLSAKHNLYKLSLQAFSPRTQLLLPATTLGTYKEARFPLARHHIPPCAGLSHHLSQLSGFHWESPAPLWP